MEIARFKRRAVFSKPAILKRNRHNIFVEKGTPSKILDIDRKERTLTLNVEGKEKFYVFSDVPFDVVEITREKIERNPLLSDGGLWTYGYIHKTPAKITTISDSPLKLQRRKPTRITPKTPRLSR